MNKRRQQQYYAKLFGDSGEAADVQPLTLSDLIEELSITTSSGSKSTTSASSGRLETGKAAPSSRGSGSESRKATAEAALRMARRVSPVLAAGGFIGALALGPAGAAFAGLNVLLGGMGVEALVAGVGLTAATATAVTVSQQQKLSKAKKNDEKLRSGAWATEICWECKKSHHGVPSDEAFRKDAEFLRRFQLLRTPDTIAAGEEDASPDTQLFPSDDEIYAFLFGVLTSPSELLSQINAQLCQAFRQRHAARQKDLSGRSAALSTASPQYSRLLKDTLHDAKMYIAHLVGATVQCFPSLASTPDAMACCSLAVERIVYADIYSIVFGEFERAFRDANDLFYDNLDEIRLEQHERAASQASSSGAVTEDKKKRSRLVLSDDLLDAEQTMTSMMTSARSPLQKLDLLCSAFRSICCFADKLHQTASSADILIPLVCAVLVESTQICGSAAAKRAFVAEIAYISFFTNGGGKGVEGYVLTSFQAAIQVIAAVDVSAGSAKELELFISDDEDADDEDDEFFDAVSSG